MEASSRRYTADILVTHGDRGGGERGNNTYPMTVFYFILLHFVAKCGIKILKSVF